MADDDHHSNWAPPLPPLPKYTNGELREKLGRSYPQLMAVDPLPMALVPFAAQQLLSQAAGGEQPAAPHTPKERPAPFAAPPPDAAAEPAVTWQKLWERMRSFPNNTAMPHKHYF